MPSTLSASSILGFNTPRPRIISLLILSSANNALSSPALGVENSRERLSQPDLLNNSTKGVYGPSSKISSFLLQFPLHTCRADIDNFLLILLMTELIRCVANSNSSVGSFLCDRLAHIKLLGLPSVNTISVRTGSSSWITSTPIFWISNISFSKISITASPKASLDGYPFLESSYSHILLVTR